MNSDINTTLIRSTALVAALAGSLALAALNPVQAQSGSSVDSASTDGAGAGAEDEQAKAAALAKATLNPIASLISLPLQNNFDWGGGPNDDGFQYKLTVQPVIPMSINEEWNVISRTIVPYVYQEDVLGRTLLRRWPQQRTRVGPPFPGFLPVPKMSRRWLKPFD